MVPPAISTRQGALAVIFMGSEAPLYIELPGAPARGWTSVAAGNFEPQAHGRSSKRSRSSGTPGSKQAITPEEPRNFTSSCFRASILQWSILECADRRRDAGIPQGCAVV